VQVWKSWLVATLQWKSHVQFDLTSLAQLPQILNAPSRWRMYARSVHRWIYRRQVQVKFLFYLFFNFLLMCYIFCLFLRIRRMEDSAAKIASWGLQDVLNRLAVVALSNKPVCFYECFAEALERDLVRRTLLEVQAEQCKFNETLRIDSFYWPAPDFIYFLGDRYYVTFALRHEPSVVYRLWLWRCCTLLRCNA